MSMNGMHKRVVGHGARTFGVAVVSGCVALLSAGDGAALVDYRRNWPVLLVSLVLAIVRAISDLRGESRKSAVDRDLMREAVRRHREEQR